MHFIPRYYVESSSATLFAEKVALAITPLRELCRWFVMDAVFPLEVQPARIPVGVPGRVCPGPSCSHSQMSILEGRSISSQVGPQISSMCIPPDSLGAGLTSQRPVEKFSDASRTRGSLQRSGGLNLQEIREAHGGVLPSSGIAMKLPIGSPLDLCHLGVDP
jgi:hypothetical protein